MQHSVLAHHENTCGAVFTIDTSRELLKSKILELCKLLPIDRLPLMIVTTIWMMHISVSICLESIPKHYGKDLPPFQLFITCIGKSSYQMNTKQNYSPLNVTRAFATALDQTGPAPVLSIL